MGQTKCHINKPFPSFPGPQIPPFKFPEIFSLEVIVTEITSPCEFWIQQMNGDLDLLMEEMWYVFGHYVVT